MSKPDDEEVFVPKGDEEDDGSSEDAEEAGVDSLLGNAFDAFQDSDRAGFIKSLKAAIASGGE